MKKTGEQIFNDFSDRWWNSLRETMENEILGTANELMLLTSAQEVTIERDGFKISIRLIDAPRIDA